MSQDNTMAEAKLEIDEGIVNCPICFERFTKPKSLPCLHTFCVQCLSTYITKCTDKEGARSNGFQCPICRVCTVPPKPEDKPKTWAEQFPTNGLILNVLELLNFRKNDTFCGPCQKRSKGYVKAGILCKDCKVCLCAECVEFHNSLLQSHSLVSVESALLCPTVVAENNVGLCPEHEETLDMFCCDDQILACPKCIAIDHRRCNKVVTAKGYARDLQSTEEIKKIDKALKNRLHEISKIVSNKERQLKELGKHKDILSQSISHFKNEMVEIFEKMEEMDLNELNEMYKEDVDHIQEDLKECECIKKSIEYSKNLLRTADICGGSDQIVSTSLKAKCDNETFKKRISKLKFEDEVMYEVDKDQKMLKFKQDAVSLKGTKHRRHRIDMNKCNAKWIHSFSAKIFSETTCRFTGIMLTADGKIVLCDQKNSKMKLFNEKGILLSYLSVRKSPFDLCYMDSKRLIVSQKDLAVLNIDGKSLRSSSTIKTVNRGFGVGYFDENIVITCPWAKPPSVNILESTGRVKRVMTSCEGDTIADDIWHLSINSVTEEIIVTVRTNDKDSELLFFSYDGESKRRMKIPDCKDSRGVDVDFKGNIYVCGMESSNIIQLSPDGSASRILLSAIDDLAKPCAISFSGTKFIVAEDGTENTDIVRTFMMQS